MYNSHLKIKNSKEGMGIGLFTEIDIPANRPIIEVFGEIHTKETMPNPDHPAWLQISNKYFIGPSGGKDDYVNHSCDPNCYINVVGRRAILFSMYHIREGSELTFDYSTTSTESLDKWKMVCFCGSFKCRNIISGYQYLSPEIKTAYEKKGIVPMYIVNPIFKDM